MHLIEILLPLFSGTGRTFPKEIFDTTRRELTDKFGGVTAFLRAPAVGLWEDDKGEVQRDDIAIFEVMTDALDRRWWIAYRRILESRFEQNEIVIRATTIERI